MWKFVKSFCDSLFDMLQNCTNLAILKCFLWKERISFFRQCCTSGIFSIFFFFQRLLIAFKMLEIIKEMTLLSNIRNLLIKAFSFFFYRICDYRSTMYRYKCAFNLHHLCYDCREHIAIETLLKYWTLKLQKCDFFQR